MRGHRWLALLPCLGIVLGVVAFNRVRPFVFGLPLLFAWLIFCILLTAAVMAVIYRLDPANRADAANGVDAERSGQ